MVILGRKYIEIFTKKLIVKLIKIIIYFIIMSEVLIICDEIILADRYKKITTSFSVIITKERFDEIKNNDNYYIYHHEYLGDFEWTTPKNLFKNSAVRIETDKTKIKMFRTLFGEEYGDRWVCEILSKWDM